MGELKVNIVRHPLISDKLAKLRNKSTNHQFFRTLVKQISIFLFYSAAAGLPVKKVEIESPLAKSMEEIVEGDIVIVPIFRAGIVMAEGILEVCEEARVGHIGIYRDESSLKPVKYYYKVPKSLPNSKITVIVDPMLATGGTAVKTVEFLKNDGAGKVTLISIIASPEGVRKVNEACPDVDIFVASVDEKLNEKGYILPGLGDAGDRLYGTK
ncbi:MAG: uracil phosphoribosyltransferase [Candidatus Edwardsbacteria bacterium GWF2_54_11]|uniref:Uracil phosphoribosyltransferase n=1 Tax=Candidatus Edwardsbacteria bacterium GWF2_54_11 TaxID=1817851 RepID=A0A1F5R0W1_9BACT|nr:MAG: uracil phosphoribosyltransferase [Candidatus Edwardsbacteria bacterium GWF2_54_11]